MGTKVYDNALDLITFSRASGGTSLRKISYGSELVTNGTFDTDLSGWTDASNGTALVEWVDGKASLDDSQGGSSVGKPKLYQTIGGAGVFLLTFDTEVDSLFTVQNETDGHSFSTTSGASRSIVISAQTASWVLSFQLENSAVARTLDNISVKEVLFDQPDGALTLFNHPDNIPRIDYNADGTVKGLLIEEQRTNLVAYSIPDSTNWGALRTVITENVSGVFTPDGEENFSLIAENGEFNSHLAVSPNISFVSGTTYTFSVFVKSASYDIIQLTFPSAAFDGANYANFNASTGSFGSNSAVSTHVEDFGGGIYRVSITATANATASGGGVIVLTNDNDALGRAPSYTGDGSSGIYIWGAQVEAGSFPTSYIPTSGASATREPDIASIPVTDFGYNQKAGTVVVEFSKITAAQRGMAFSVGDAANDGFSIDGHSDAKIRAYVENSGTLIFSDLSLDTYAENEVSSAGIAYKSGSFAATANGNAATTGSGVLTSNDLLTQMRIGQHAYSLSPTYLNGHIKSIQYYPRKLSDTQLQELTA